MDEVLTNNSSLVLESVEAVDEINTAFYGRFPYPQRPLRFDYLEEPDFERRLLNQDLGDYRHELVPPRPDIWVAGCGTNQAAITALRFRKGNVVGTDLSGASLDLCKRNASALGICNLTLERESINRAGYRNAFDHVICTGVIHHNAEPAAALACLASALRPRGILELMVYNRYHWGLQAAFQEALRIFTGEKAISDFNSKLSVVRRLMDAFPVRAGLLSGFLEGFNGASEEVVADALLQPVLHSYTIQSLAKLAASCGLHIVTHCVSMHDRARGTISWELIFPDAELQERYNALPDLSRWQITNLLSLDRSPHLWFYLQRDDGPSRVETRQLCEGFLKCVFRRASATRRFYEDDGKGSFSLSPVTIPHPPTTQDRALVSILKLVDGRTPMHEILKRLGSARTFQQVNALRIQLSTSAFPYLIGTPPMTA
jgi:SAM-dependent methyltransferase